MKQDRNISNAFLCVIVVALFVFILATSNNPTGQAVLPVNGNCWYGNDVENYVQTAPNPTGNNYCKSKGYTYAAFVDRSRSSILFDSINGQCFLGGNIQVDERVSYYRVTGSTLLQGWSNNQCILQNSPGFVEPEYGDTLVIQKYDGALCCSK